MKPQLLTLILTVALLATGCGTKVSSINKKPQKFAGKTVKLTGVVRQVESVPPQEKTPGMTLYQFSDTPGGGEDTLIWVIRGPESSQKSVIPSPSFRLSLEGVVEAEHKVRGRVYSPVIIEKSAQQEIPTDAPASFG